MVIWLVLPGVAPPDVVLAAVVLAGVVLAGVVLAGVVLAGAVAVSAAGPAPACRVRVDPGAAGRRGPVAPHPEPGVQLGLGAGSRPSRPVARVRAGRVATAGTGSGRPGRLTARLTVAAAARPVPTPRRAGAGGTGGAPRRASLGGGGAAGVGRRGRLVNPSNGSGYCPDRSGRFPQTGPAAAPVDLSPAARPANRARRCSRAAAGVTC